MGLWLFEKIRLIYFKFNFEVDKVEDVCKQLDYIRVQKRISNLVCIDVYYENTETKKKVLMERWCIHTDQTKKQEIQSSSPLAAPYIQGCALMRSLHTHLLLMPGYKLFRRNQRNRMSNIKVNFLITNVEPYPNVFEAGMMKRFVV